MSDFDRLPTGLTAEQAASGLTLVGTSERVCAKCQQKVTITQVATPDSKDGYGRLIKGKTMSIGFCACNGKSEAEMASEHSKKFASLVHDGPGNLPPGAWRRASIDSFDWYADERTTTERDKAGNLRGPFPWGTKPHEDRIRRYVATLPERLEKGQGLWLRGSKGMGKSMICSAILTAAAEQGISGRFEQCGMLVRRLTKGDGKAQAEYLKLVTTAKILVIDDLGTEDASPWGREALNTVVDSRYSNMLVTITTTNLTTDQWQDQYSGYDVEAIGRLADRLLERNRPQTWFGESYRARLREDW